MLVEEQCGTYGFHILYRKETFLLWSPVTTAADVGVYKFHGALALGIRMNTFHGVRRWSGIEAASKSLKRWCCAEGLTTDFQGENPVLWPSLTSGVCTLSRHG